MLLTACVQFSHKSNTGYLCHLYCISKRFICIIFFKCIISIMYSKEFSCRETAPLSLTAVYISHRALIKAVFVFVLQKTRTMTHICPTLKWSQNSGAKRPERRNALPWRSFLMFSRSIMGINSSFQTGIWFLLEVSWSKMKFCVYYSSCLCVCVCAAVWMSN